MNRTCYIRVGISLHAGENSANTGCGGVGGYVIDNDICYGGLRDNP